MLQKLKKELFRKKSLERISSPERIDDYVKAISVRLWIVAAACMIVVLSLLLWGIFGKVEITQTAVTVCRGGVATCFVGENNIDDIGEKTDFRINGKSYAMSSVSDVPEKVSEAMPEYAAHVGLYSKDSWVYAALLRADLDDGIYETEVITKSVSPILLLTN